MANDYGVVQDKYFLNDDDGSPLITKSRYYELDELSALMETVNTDHHLNVLNVNARSLVKHYLEFCSILSELPMFHVITIEETWLDKSLEPLVKMDNYQLITKHKYKCKNGGGLGIYIRRDLKFVERIDLKCPLEFQELFD